MPTPLVPLTSTNPGTGMIANSPAGGPATNPEWIKAFVDYWVGRWANGDHVVPNGWVSAQFGEPDPTDTAGAFSPRTILAFTRYAQAYKPGMDPNVDQLMPWTAPGPNDYIEDPVVTAARIANEQWQQTFDQNAKQFGINMDQRQREAVMNAFNNAFQNELTKYATAANIYSTQTQAALNAYNTTAGIYNANENNRSSNLVQAGNLSQAAQSIADARTQALIKLQANPGDFVERESTVRAMNAPKGTNQPAFKNIDTLGEVIRRLIDYQPNTPPPAPATPMPAAPPVAPNQNTFQLPPGATPTITPTPVSTATPPNMPTPTSPLPVVQTPLSPVPAGSGTTYNPPPSPNANPVGQDSSGANRTVGPGGMLLPKAFAMGTTTDRGTALKKMIIGDTNDGLPNPELVEVTGQNVRTRITPLRSPQMTSGMPRNMGTPNGRGNTKPPGNSKLRGTRMFATGTGLPNGTIKSYDDSAYQNLPSLQYLQGRINRTDYNRLNTGSATGAFGVQLPESGALNYRKALDLDPVSLALIQSQYRSGSRDFDAELSRAKARAPFGNAIATSLVRT